MLSLILAAATAVPVPPTPLQYYSQALATMQRLAEPAYVSFQTNLIARGMGIAEPCDHGKITWNLGWGSQMHGDLAWHTVYTSASNDETIRTAEGATCSGPAETFDRPTWRDAYAWVRYGFSQVPNAAAQSGAPRGPANGLKTIADVSVIAPGAYRISDGGAQNCPSGAPGHELHFVARFDPMKHLLRDAVVDTQSMRICMIRLDLDSYQAAGTGYRGDLRLDFGDVDGNWIITRGHAVFAARMAGISLKTATFDFWYTNVTFPSTVAAASVAPKKPPYDVNWYLRPQRLVDVFGRRMNILCTGRGSPTVILEAGLIADSAAWRLVQPAISRHTRVCSYDRAGLGFSDPAGPPRDASAIVDDLHVLLSNARIGPPYVLVGWSSGGLYTRLYQYRYPHEVAGLVEVDPDSEFEDDGSKIVTTMMHKPPHWFEQQIQAWYKQYDNCAINVSRGTCAFFPGGLAGYQKRLRALGCPKSHPIPCALAEVRGEHLDRGSLWRDEALELEASTKSEAELRAARLPYGNLPLIVLTDSEEGDIDSGPITVATQRALWVAKNQAEERVARLSSVGAHFVVAGSTHAIQLDHPSVVISAVDEVVDQARSARARCTGCPHG